MNRIYKVIWSKVKHQYVVVSELARSRTKGAKSTVNKKLGKTAAALLTVLAISAGAGIVPVQAANDNHGTGNNVWGNDNTIYGDNNYMDGDNNYIKGDENFLIGKSTGNNVIIGNKVYMSSSHDTVYIGEGNGSGSNQNMNYVQDSAAFGDNIYIHGVTTSPTTDTLVVGNTVTLNSTNKTIVFGSDNWVGSADNSLIIGDRVQIVSGKVGSERLDSTVVIGDDVQIGHHLDGSTASSASAAGDNITVIGDRVNVDNTTNRTNSSNSLIYGNDVDMIDSPNSIAIGNNLDIRGVGLELDDDGTGNPVASSGNTVLGYNINVGQLESHEGNYPATDDNVVMGSNIDVSGLHNVVIGGDIDLDASGSKSNVVVIGHNADTTGIDSIAVGADAKSSANSITIGVKAQAEKNATVIGQYSSVAEYSTLIGTWSNINSSYSVGLGQNLVIDTGSNGSTAIGNYATIGTDSANAIAIGGANSEGEPHATIGNNSNKAIAIGTGASIADKSNDSIALGTNAQVGSHYMYGVTGFTMSGIAIGTNSNVEGEHGIALGYGAKILGNTSASGNSIAIGNSASVDQSSNSVSIGSKSKILKGASNSVAIGSESIGEWSTNSVAMGAKTTIGNNSSYAIAIGNTADIGEEADYSIAMGNKAKIGDNTKWSIAMGAESSIADGLQTATAIGGYQAIVNAYGGTALGSYTQVDSEYSTAVGYKSKVTADDIFTDTDLAAFKEKLGTAYTNSYNIKDADSPESGVFSVGDDNKERRVINVARGRISEDSTDAVNGSQLYGLADDLNKKIEKAGGDWNLTTNGGTTDNEKTVIGKGNTVDFAGVTEQIPQGETTTDHQNVHVMQETQYQRDEQGEIVTDEDGNPIVTGTNVTFGLDDKLVIGDKNQITIDGSNGAASINLGNNIALNGNTGEATFGNVKVNQDDKFVGNEQLAGQHNNTITGLTNTYWDENDPNIAHSGRAATEEQLQSAINSVYYTAGDGIDIDGREIKVNNGVGLTFAENQDGETRDLIVKEGQGITVNEDGVNAKLGGGLGFSTTNDAIQVNTGRGLKINTENGANNVEADLGEGLTFNDKDQIKVNYGGGLEIDNDGKLKAKVDGSKVWINDQGALTAKDTTLDEEASKSSPTANGYGNDYKVVDTDGNTVNITDVASASKLEEVDNKVTNSHWTVSTNNGTDPKTDIKNGNVVDFASDDGNIKIKQTPTDNGTNLTFDLNDDINVNSVTAGDTIVDTKGVAIKNGGSYNYYITNEGLNANGNKITHVAEGKAPTDAVNVSQLEGAIAGTYKGWNVTANGNTAEGNTIADGNTVDFAGKTDENGHSNIVVEKQDTKDGANLKFDLADDITVNSVTAGNTIVDTKGVAIKNGDEYDYYITNKGLNANGNKIENVAKGEADTDAVNVGQLNEAVAGTYKGWNVTANGNTAESNTIADGNTVDFAGKTDENGHSNVLVEKQDTKDGSGLKFDLNDKVVLGEDADKQIVLDGTTGNVSIGDVDVANGTGISFASDGSATFGKIQVNKENSGSTIIGLTNTEWNQDGTYNSGRAATEEQLQDAIGQVNENAYQGWKVSVNGGEDVLVEKGDIVDFSSADNAEGTKNVVITQDGTNLTFDLSDRIVLGDSTSPQNQILLDGMNGSAFFGGISGVSISRSAEYGNGYIISGLANTTWTYGDYAAGKYKDSNKAATEAQLHSAFDYLDNRIDSMEIDSDENITVTHPDSEKPGSSTGGEGEGGTTTTPGTGTGNGNHYIELNDDIVLGTTDENGKVTNPGSLTVKDPQGHEITINKDLDGDGLRDGVISGMTNTTWDYNKYQEGGYATSSNAATEAQLHQALGGTVQYDRNEDGSVNKGSITLNEGGTTIHNVAPGEVSESSMDAVNGSQLYSVQQQVDNNSNAINNMGNQINRLGDRIDKVGAGAAALAALHPLDFDPDDKLSFAAGYGNYAGENAVAIGAFYQPNEDTLFSVGGTVGNDENMVNVGVSFKLGQKNHVSNSRVAMAKEVISLRDEVAQLKALMAHSGILPANGQIDTSALFPDVPENHWAYEYVHELAKLGIVEGYPDGNFDGDRMMTRYEFAAIVYRAMQKGVNVDRRMLSEFEPELKLIRVDVVAKDRDGNPTIERVRVNEPEQQQA